MLSYDALVRTFIYSSTIVLSCKKLSLCIPYHDEYLFFPFLKLMTKEISAGIEGDTELGDQVSNHTVQYLLLDHRDTKCVCTGSS